MKRFGLWVMALALCAAPAGRAQDAATEERLKQLSGKIDDLIAGQEALHRRLEELAGQVQTLREQQNRPAPNYAGQEDLLQLKKAIEEVDNKRIEDNQRIRAELLRLIEAVKAAPLGPVRPGRGANAGAGPRSRNPAAADNSAEETATGAERHEEYHVVKGDNLTRIIARYKRQHILVTEQQIVDANPGLDPNRLRPGMKLRIPLPPSAQ